MDKTILVIEAEDYQDRAKTLPVPLIAYGICTDDNQDVLLVYEYEEAA